MKKFHQKNAKEGNNEGFMGQKNGYKTYCKQIPKQLK